MDRIPTIRDQYTGKPVHQIAALRLIWPHPGMHLLEGEIQEGELKHLPLSAQRGAFDTRGIDMMLILLRHLKSFGLAVDLDGEHGLTASENAFLKAADLDLGWNQAEDWHMKREIFDKLRNDLGDQGAITAEAYSFDRSLRQLRCIFEDNLQFSLLSGTVVGSSANGMSTSIIQEDSSTVPSCGTYDGVYTLSHWMENNFSGTSSDKNRPVVFIGARPKFLAIKYINKDSKRTLADLRVLKYQAPELDNRSCCVQDATFHLIACSRHSQGGGDICETRTFNKDGS